ncbi:MAG: hypothetical protein WDO18_09200 [Acidobacteriota bacterium]
MSSLRTPLAALETACDTHGISGGRLTDENGRAQAGFTIRRFPTPRILAQELLGLNRLVPSNGANRSYRYLDRDLATPGPADQPAGAFLMVRRDVWQRIAGFDQSLLAHLV